MIKIYTFLTPMLKLDFPCFAITLRARKALRVIYTVLTPMLTLDFPCFAITLRTRKALRVISPSINLVSRMLPGHSRSILEAHRIIPNRFRENSKFHENLDFSESQKNVFFSRKFAQTIESTQRLHRWIAF